MKQTFFMLFLALTVHLGHAQKHSSKTTVISFDHEFSGLSEEAKRKIDTQLAKIPVYSPIELEITGVSNNMKDHFMFGGLTQKRAQILLKYLEKQGRVVKKHYVIETERENYVGEPNMLQASPVQNEVFISVRAYVEPTPYVRWSPPTKDIMATGERTSGVGN